MLITGPSGSGKTTLSDSIISQLSSSERPPSELPALIHQDKYFIKPFVPYGSRVDDSLERAEGNVDFCSLFSDVSDAMKGHPVVLVEGHVCHRHPHLLSLASLVVVLYVDSEVCKVRRLGRKQRSAEELEDLAAYIDGFVTPFYAGERKFLTNFRKRDNNNDNNDDVVDEEDGDRRRDDDDDDDDDDNNNNNGENVKNGNGKNGGMTGRIIWEDNPRFEPDALASLIVSRIAAETPPPVVPLQLTQVAEKEEEEEEEEEEKEEEEEVGPGSSLRSAAPPSAKKKKHPLKSLALQLSELKSVNTQQAKKERAKHQAMKGQFFSNKDVKIVKRWIELVAKCKQLLITILHPLPDPLLLWSVVQGCFNCGPFGGSKCFEIGRLVNSANSWERKESKVCGYVDDILEASNDFALWLTTHESFRGALSSNQRETLESFKKRLDRIIKGRR